MKAILLVDTDIGLKNLIKVWEETYNFSFDLVYTNPEKLKAQVPYMSEELNIVVIGRNLVNWGVFQLEDLVSFASILPEIRLSILSIIDIDSVSFGYSVLKMMGSIRKLQGSIEAYKIFGEMLKECKGHFGANKQVLNSNVSELVYKEAITAVSLQNIAYDGLTDYELIQSI